MEKTFGDTFKEFLGERRTSPMYKSFIISWCLWNWNFLYILVAENGDKIFEKYKILKSEYLASVYAVNRDIVFSWNFYTIFTSRGFWHAFGGPIISVGLFYFILNQIELVIREKANQNLIKQYKSDKILKDQETELKESNNKELEVELETRKKEIELEKEKLKSELEKKKIEVELEKEQLKSQLQKKNRELELEKTKKQIEKNNEISSLEEWNQEYEEALSIGYDFTKAIEGLKKLAGDITPEEELKLLNEIGYIYTTYNLYNKGFYGDYNNYNLGSVTEKGKFFLRKKLARGDIKNKKVSDGNIYKGSSNGEIDNDLPF